ncbi:hypothetical protein RBSWK_00161 [Rhodopirellula baltica SWK14]|uniref:Uncharacterized protein n=1 Tax=Rhodopirellula baltica SWK14 TaxID=993516 RepID=L7CNN6_RHOBT|nr:hypothetical protein RBSWK_00161 [Rhodopirellula baltica SWK14]
MEAGGGPCHRDPRRFRKNLAAAQLELVVIVVTEAIMVDPR